MGVRRPPPLAVLKIPPQRIVCWLAGHVYVCAVQGVCFFEQPWWGVVKFWGLCRSTRHSAHCTPAQPVPPDPQVACWHYVCLFSRPNLGNYGGQRGSEAANEAVCQVCCLQHAGGPVGRIDILAHLLPLLVCVCLCFQQHPWLCRQGSKECLCVLLICPLITSMGPSFCRPTGTPGNAAVPF